MNGNLFEEAYRLSMHNEGKGIWSNRKEDRGGETYSGITRKHHPHWYGWILIENFKQKYPNSWKDLVKRDPELLEQVRNLYYNEYWKKPNINSIAEEDKEIGFKMFDILINIGPRVLKWFQQAINLLNRNGKLYPDIKVDGGIGPITIKHFQYAITKNPPKRFMTILRSIQGHHYIRLMEIHPEQELNIGWIDRVEL